MKSSGTFIITVFFAVALSITASFGYVKYVEKKNQERHDFDDHHDHGLSESAEDMASEGGHIEEDTPEDIELYKNSSKKS